MGIEESSLVGASQKGTARHLQSLIFHHLFSGTYSAFSESRVGDLLASWLDHNMIQIELIRELNVEVESGYAFVSAASGLVLRDKTFYVIADDSHHLGVFPLDRPTEPGRLIRILPGDLPLEHHARKKQKPDFEILIELNSELWPPYGALMAWPSGSKPNRTRGVAIPFQADQSLAPATLFNAEPLLRNLGSRIPELNLEGAVLMEDRIRFFQRGNSRDGFNATFDLKISPILERIRDGKPIEPQEPQNFKRWDLGTRGSAPLTFTDATDSGENGVIFLTAAEATESTYEDGQVMGAILGLLRSDSTWTELGDLSMNLKAEGLAILRTGLQTDIYLVTDADSDTVPARLYRARVSL